MERKHFFLSLPFKSIIKTKSLINLFNVQLSRKNSSFCHNSIIFQMCIFIENYKMIAFIKISHLYNTAKSKYFYFYTKQPKIKICMFLF